MKHVSSLIPQRGSMGSAGKTRCPLLQSPALTQPKPTQQSSEPLPEAWIVALHQRFMAMYGTRFRSQFKTQEALDAWITTWAAGLTGVKPEQIKAGLVTCLGTYPDEAPTLGQFRRLCTGSQRRLYLPGPRDTKDRRPQIAAILSRLRGAKGAGETSE